MAALGELDALAVVAAVVWWACNGAVYAVIVVIALAMADTLVEVL
jgi:cytochrome c biogenesis protein CcdA